MADEQDKFSINEDDMCSTDFNLPLDDEDIMKAVEEPKLPETQNTAIANWKNKTFKYRRRIRSCKKN